MKDLTVGNEYKALVFFSLPILVGNLFQQFYNVADSIVVGRILGKEALAAVGFCFQISLILIALSMGLTLGSGIVISRLFGARDVKRIGTAIDSTVVMILALAVVVTAFGVVFCEDIIRFFAVPADTHGHAVTYLRIIFAGTLPSFLYCAVTNILCGLGDSKGPVYFLVGAALINIVLDIVFVKYCGMGIAGAAYATIISQAFSCVGCIVYMRVRYPQYPLHFFKPDFNWGVLRECLALGAPSMAQQIFRSAGFMTLQFFVNGFGSAAMAAYAVTTKIDSFAQLPALNLGQALSNFVAQNRGAGKDARALKGFRAALYMGWAISLSLTLVVILCPAFLIGLFTDAPEVLAVGRQYLYIVGAFYCVEATMQMLNGVLLSYEKPFAPMLSTVVSLCVMQVPAAWLLSSTALGANGIWMAAPFGWLGGVAIRYYYYRRLLPSIRATSATAP